MKIALLLFAAGVLTVQAAPVTYEMTFAGLPGAPQSGMFTYDPVSGFSNFLVQWSPFTLDLTASANAPMYCSNSVCVPSTAAAEFETLTTSDTWTGLRNQPIFSFPGVLILSIGPSSSMGGDYISAQVSIPGPGVGGVAGYSGDYTLTAAAPEPAKLWLLSLCGLGVAGRRKLRGMLFT